MKKFIAIILCFSSIGCSMFHKTEQTQTVILRPEINELEKDTVPGTVDDVWVEPMYNNVRVNGQIDPKGVYYRKAHNSIVQIRPGKYQMQEYPDDRDSVK